MKICLASIAFLSTLGASPSMGNMALTEGTDRTEIGETGLVPSIAKTFLANDLQ